MVTGGAPSTIIKEKVETTPSLFSKWDEGSHYGLLTLSLISKLRNFQQLAIEIVS